MKLFRILFIGLFVLSFNSASLRAEDGLKVSDVGSFLNSTEALQPLADEMEGSNIPHFFDVRPMNMTAKNVPSHLKATENIKKNYPEYYKRMSDIITNHEFDGSKHYDSVEEWARMADRIILAFYTSRSDGGGRNFKEMAERAAPIIKMSKMDPEMGKQMQGVLDMLESFSKVTDADRQVVRQFNEQLAIHFASYPQ